MTQEDTSSAQPAGERDTATRRGKALREVNDLSTPLYGLFGLGVLYTLYIAHQIVLPIILAILASLLLAPVVTRGARAGIPRFASSLVLVLALLAGILGLGWTVMTPALEWAEDAPEGISRLLVGQSTVRNQIEKVSESARKVEESMEGLAEDESREQPTTVVLQTESWRSQMMTRARNGVAGLALALALTYFLLVSGDRLIHNFIRQLPAHQRRRALIIVADCQSQIAQYLGVIGLSNLTVGTLTGFMCWAIGLPDPAIWGLVAGLARFIPYLGVILTIALLAVVSATSLDEVWLMAIAPVGYLVLTSMVGFFIEPWIHGFRMAINPVIIFVAIFFWGWLWGPVGVLLAVPLMTVIQVVLKQIPRLRPVYRVIAR